jgi:cytochrome c oxidase subunit 1
MFNDTLGKLHFWFTFIGTYLIYFPMHYLGFLGMPRRYYEYEGIQILPESAQTLNEFITIAALVVGVSQLIFFYNFIYSYFWGPKSDPNPWKATTMEWQTPDNPAVHGNWGPKLPEVYRWAYDYSVPGAKEDFIPQNVPADDKGLHHRT